MNTLIKQMSDFKNNFLMILAVLVKHKWDQVTIRISF